MVRSMYSGVSGMRAHQVRLDTIGNNIANVNTVGYKGSRVTFRDIYYQSMRSASAASASKGGVNPSQVGVGSQVASVDVMQSRSTFTQTDMTMDLAIDGEGFFQVQDANGNKFFTRAGQLNFDSVGNLVDSKGNFVLGVSGDPTGKAAGSNLIQVNLPPVSPAASSGVMKVNGVEFTLSTSNNSKDGNVGVSLISDNTMPIGQKATAEVGPNGIVVRLNSAETFTSLTDLNTEMNRAIESYMQTTTGSSHPAGTFTLSCNDPDKVFNVAGGGLTGKEIASADFSVVRGKVNGWVHGDYTTGGLTFKSVGDQFSGAGSIQSVEVTDVPGPPASKSIIVIAGDGTTNKTYTASLNESQANGGSSIILKNGNSTSDYIELGIPSGWNGIKATTDNGKSVADGGTLGKFDLTAQVPALSWTTTASVPSKNVGLSYSKFVLKNGTNGGEQGIESLTGIQIGPDGTIVGTSGEDGKNHYIGRIDLVTFANPSGLIQSGGTYFTTSENSGALNYTKPGEGGSGATISGSLELSNVDLSREFTDMIGTQRGYQANARIITVSDTLLEELVNLKR